MAKPVIQSAAECLKLVRQRDEDRWLAARYAGDADQRKLIALYAFHTELQRIPSLVSEPPLGEIRLQWWREAFDEIRQGKMPRAHPVVQEIAAVNLLADDAAAALMGSAIDATARLLYDKTFADINDLTAFLENAVAYVDVAAVGLLGGDASDEEVRCAGVLFALARDGAQLAPNLDAEISTYAADQQYAGENLRRLTPRQTPAVLHLVLTKRYLKKQGRFPVVKRLMLLRAMLTGRL